MAIKNRNYYQRILYNYNKRREKMKRKIKEKRNNDSKRLKHISKKIGTWQRQLDRMDDKQREIKKYDEVVRRFIGVSAKTANNGPEKEMARKLLCKHALENGVRVNAVSIYCGFSNRDDSDRVRREFNRSFPSDSANRQMWERFKIYLEEIK